MFGAKLSQCDENATTRQWTGDNSTVTMSERESIAERYGRIKAVRKSQKIPGYLGKHP
jgi:hypothetical protein